MATPSYGGMNPASYTIPALINLLGSNQGYIAHYKPVIKLSNNIWHLNPVGIRSCRSSQRAVYARTYLLHHVGFTFTAETPQHVLTQLTYVRYCFLRLVFQRLCDAVSVSLSLCRQWL